MSATWTVRIYRALLRAYPRSFREEYGDDMVRLLADQCADEPAWLVASRLLSDLALTVPSQHLEARMNRTPNLVTPAGYAAVALGGATLAAVAGSNLAALFFGLAIAVLAGAFAWTGWRRQRPMGPAPATASWWKLVIAGPGLIAVVLVSASLGVDAWFVGLATVFAAVFVTVAGLVLGIVHAFTRRVTVPNQ